MRIEHPPMSQFVSLESNKNLLEKASGLQGGKREDEWDLEKESFSSGLSRLISCSQTSMPGSHSLLSFFMPIWKNLEK